MKMSRGRFMKDVIRPIALVFVSASFGGLVALLLRAFLDLDLATLTTSGITFAFAAFAAFVLFPRVLRLPFGDVGWSVHMRRLGFYWPRGAWKHVLLGVLLAACTLSGMLIGSLLTGRYEVDWSTVNLTHTLFSVNPGLWEEYFYRGVIMFVLLAATRSVRRAAVLQIVLFGLAHIKGTDLWSWVDVISVMVTAVGFTYAAFKTRTLVASIAFHFLHDAFLFLPQVPGADYVGVSENVGFFAALWLMVGVGCLLVKLASERLGVKAAEELYVIEPAPSAPDRAGGTVRQR
jgi:hypothetical protein